MTSVLKRTHSPERQRQALVHDGPAGCAVLCFNLRTGGVTGIVAIRVGSSTTLTLLQRPRREDIVARTRWIPLWKSVSSAVDPAPIIFEIFLVGDVSTTVEWRWLNATTLSNRATLPSRRPVTQLWEDAASGRTVSRLRRRQLQPLEQKKDECTVYNDRNPSVDARRPGDLHARKDDCPGDAEPHDPECVS
jgi:hypothetical protein